MKKFIKKADRDFVILNLTDIHMDDDKLQPGCNFLEILHRTLDELIERVHPDLITITGDLAWGGNHAGQIHLIERLDAYGIPWAPVMGNHDHEVSTAGMTKYETMFANSPLCCYVPGDPTLGNGNYTILIEDETTGKAVEGLIFIDSHSDTSRLDTSYLDENGEVISGYDKLWANQLVWYTDRVEEFKTMGCPETVIFQHIPPYGFREAWDVAFRSDLNPRDMPAPEGGTDCWNPGYEASSGVHYEGVGCHPVQDGVLDVIAASDSTKYIFCGHEHVNNWQIKYRGVNLVYTLKTGSGCYWHPALNGGTVIRIVENGVSSVEHVYVEIPQELCDTSEENVLK